MEMDHFIWEDIPKIELFLKIPKEGEVKIIKNATVTFRRDQNYRLLYQIKANIDKFPQSFDNILKLLTHTPLLVEGQNNRLSGSFKTSNPIHFNSQETFSDEKKIELTISGEAHQLDLKSKNNSEAETGYKFFWFNNSDENFCWNTTTDTEITSKLKIKFGDYAKYEIAREVNRNMSWNSFVCRFNGISFLFGKVPSNNKLKASFIHVDFNDLKLDEINSIKSIFGFLSGSPLIPIGYTIFNKNWKVSERRLLSTNRFDVEQLLALSAQKVVPTSQPQRIQPPVNWSSKISELLENYYLYHKQFPLGEIIENIHSHITLPLRLKIQPLSTALDLLREAWFKSKLSTSKGKNLNDTEFNAIISKYINDIRTHLGDKKTPEPILNKIKTANNMSGNQRNDTFFKNLV
jgi:hypothetical protein